MEFSFDRSKESQPQAQAQTNTQSAGPRPGPDLNTVDPSTIANERLRKAIERNRAKQAERDAGRPAMAAQPQQQAQPAQPQYQEPPQREQQREQQREVPPQRPTFVSPQAEPVQPTYSQAQAQTTRENHEQASFFANAAAQADMHAQHSQEQEIPRARENARLRSTSVVSRRSTAKPEDTEFVPVKRTTRKVASQISYATGSASASRKKTKSMDPKYVGWLVKGSWIFCGLMVLRLIFAAGGVTDYYSQKSSVNARIAELTDIKKENMTLVREIERMRSDTGFQKKLVRDNLGFIASDEFLVLFPKGN